MFLKKDWYILLNNLYAVIEASSSKITVKLSCKNHPVFKAHFPKSPILPGFLQIDIISKILDDKISNIKYSKFINLIYPDDIIVYNIKTLNNQKTIIIQKNNKKISEIRYETK